jgi:phosphoglycolate phosphatase-like HAD superfamily hydrolase
MQLVMFDIDGTLTQSNELDDAAYLQALSDVFGFTEISSDWTSYSHVTDACILREICEQQLGRIPSEAETAAFQQRFLELLAQGADSIGGIQPISGAATILAKLRRSSNHAIAYAGGAWTASALFKLGSANLPQDIPAAFSDEDESREGITAVALARAEQHYGQTFTNIVYIGDGVWDIRSSRKSGYAFIGLAIGDDAEALRAEGATQIFPNYDDSEAFLTALSRY